MPLFTGISSHRHKFPSVSSGLPGWMGLHYLDLRFFSDRRSCFISSLLDSAALSCPQIDNLATFFIDRPCYFILSSVGCCCFMSPTCEPCDFLFFLTLG